MINTNTKCCENTNSTETNSRIPDDDIGLFELAKAVINNVGNRKIVTWIRSSHFDRVLQKYFGKKVEFGVSMRPEAVNGKDVKAFEILEGRSDEYFLVALDRSYDQDAEDILRQYGYIENQDYIYRIPETIVLKDHDFTKKSYFEKNGNRVEGFSGVVKRIVLKGRNNHVSIGRGIKHPENLVIVMNSNCKLTIGDDFETTRELQIEFTGNTLGTANVTIGKSVRTDGGYIKIFEANQGSSVFIGDMTFLGERNELYVNPGNRIHIGSHCAFSQRVVMQAGGGYTAFDVNTGKKLNYIFENVIDNKHSIVFGNHVRVDRGALIQNGTWIGNGSIVDAMSVVKGIYPNNCVISGNPAKIVKCDVAWAEDIETDDISRCGFDYIHKTKKIDYGIDARKALIMGGTGRITILLTSLCVERGYSVTIATRGKSLFGVADSPVEIIVLDRNDKEANIRALAGTEWDVVFDCSGYTPQAIDYLLSCIKCNRYVYLSSFEVYIDSKCQGKNVKEDSLDINNMRFIDSEETNAFETARLQSEFIIAKKYKGINYVIVRTPSLVLDHDVFDDSANSLLEKYVWAVVNGVPINPHSIDNSYSFIECKDEADFLVYISECDYIGVVNFASEGDISIREVIECAEKMSGKKAIYDENAPDMPFTNFPEITLDLRRCLSLGYTPVPLKTWLINGGGQKEYRHTLSLQDMINRSKQTEQPCKNWLITGCSSGLGFQLAKKLFENGYTVAATSRNIEKLSELPDGIIKIALDVKELSSCQNAVDIAVREMGSIDVLINNAGVSHTSTFEETPEEIAANVIETNYWGVANMFKAIIPYMRKQRYGVVVNIGSASSFRPRNYGTYYVASKFAEKNLSYNMKYECQRFMKVLNVEIGGMNTGLNKRQTVIHTKYDCYRNLSNPYPFKTGFTNDIFRISDTIIHMAGREMMPRSIVLGCDAYQQFKRFIRLFEDEIEKNRSISFTTDKSKSNEISIEEVTKQRNKKLKVQRWLITGASEGFGRVLAMRLFELGYTVTVTSRNIEKLKSFPDEIYKLESQLDCYEECKHVIDTSIKLMGSLDVLVNNATSNCWCSFEECDYEVMRGVFYTNYTLPQYMMKAAIPYFREKNNGTVVNISSIAGIQPRARVSTYSAAKAALEGVTRALKYECSNFARIMAVELVAMQTNIMKNNPNISTEIDDYKGLSLYTQEVKDIRNRNDIAAQQIINLVNSEQLPSSLLIGTESYLIAKNEIQRMNEEFALYEDVTWASFNTIKK